MNQSDGGQPSYLRQGPLPDLPALTIATTLREDGITGVQSYVRRLRRYLDEREVPTELITPFSWLRPLTVPVFGPRILLERFSGSAGTFWYRHWHAAFVYQALRRHLGEVGECVVYAQDPLAARAALRARRGPHQLVVLAVHFRISQADEFADKRLIPHDGAVFRWIRRTEREVMPQVDGLVYMSRWARDAVLEWLPEVADVPSAIVGCPVTPLRQDPVRESLGDLVTVGNLDIVKNHRFLLSVLAEARALGRPYTLDVFGEGPLHKELTRQVQALGLEQQVRLHGFRPDARRFLPGYRAYVHSCYSESFCLAVVEAMAAGLPVVIGGIGPLPELCDDGVEGRFWPLNDPVRSAAILIDVLDNEAVRAEAGLAAAKRFSSNYDADVIIPRLMSFLAERFETGSAARAVAESVGEPVRGSSA
jgi:glycosyltransferase involved in cell wall biosynthesis